MTTHTTVLPTDVRCVRFNHSAKYVCCGGTDKAAHVIPFGGTSRIAHLRGDSGAVTAVAFDAVTNVEQGGSARVVTGSEQGIIVTWDLTNEKQVSVIKKHTEPVVTLDYHPFFFGFVSGSLDGSLRVWDMRQQRSVQTFRDNIAPLTQARFSPCGEWLVSGCQAGVLRFYNLNTLKSFSDDRVHRGSITSIGFHPCESLFCASSADGTLSLWDAKQCSMQYKTSASEGGYSGALCVPSAMVGVVERGLKVFRYDSLSNHTATRIEAPWTTTADVCYSETSKSVHAVECRGKVLFMSEVPLAQSDVDPCARRPPPVQSRGPTGAPSKSPSRGANVGKFLTGKDDRRGKGAAGVKMGGVAFDVPLVDPPPQPPAAAVGRPPAPTSPPPIPQRVAPVRGEPTGGNLGDPTEAAVLAELRNTSTAMQSVLQRRLTHARIVRQEWQRDPAVALQHLVKLSGDAAELGVVGDFLSAMQNQRVKEKISIEMAPYVLTLAAAVIKTGRGEGSIVAAIRGARMCNNKFRNRIDEVMRGAAISQGVDLNLEARVERCRALQKAFDEVYVLIGQFAQRHDTVGEESRHLLSELPRPRNIS